jgi:hypothetical protein
MADRPTSAFASSLVGGLITLATTLLVINSWFAMYSTNGTAFGYSQWLVVASINLTAMEGLVLLFVGVSCAIVILVGGALQYSGKKSRVRDGSTLVLIGTIIGIPTTSFGWLLGGLMSTLGAYLGFGWKPSNETELPAKSPSRPHK